MFVRQGVLTKSCRKANKRFTFFLFSDMLLYADQLPADRYRERKENAKGGGELGFVFIINNFKFRFIFYIFFIIVEVFIPLKVLSGHLPRRGPGSPNLFLIFVVFIFFFV